MEEDRKINFLRSLKEIEQHSTLKTVIVWHSTLKTVFVCIHYNIHSNEDSDVLDFYIHCYLIRINDRNRKEEKFQYISLHFISLHFISFHFISIHFFSINQLKCNFVQFNLVKSKNLTFDPGSSSYEYVRNWSR